MTGKDTYVNVLSAVLGKYVEFIYTVVTDNIKMDVSYLFLLTVR